MGALTAGRRFFLLEWGAQSLSHWDGEATAYPDSPDGEVHTLPQPEAFYRPAIIYYNTMQSKHNLDLLAN